MMMPFHGRSHAWFIKMIRPDNKIDVALQVQGYQSIEPNAEKFWIVKRAEVSCV
jgi:hypothetical protein